MIAGQVQCAAGHWHFKNQVWAHVNCTAAAEVSQAAVNTSRPRAVNRGAYPNTDARREYMRQKMAARRSAARQAKEVIRGQ